MKRWELMPLEPVSILEKIKTRLMRGAFRELKQEGAKGWSLQEKMKASRDMKLAEFRNNDYKAKQNQLA